MSLVSLALSGSLPQGPIDRPKQRNRERERGREGRRKEERKNGES